MQSEERSLLSQTMDAESADTFTMSEFFAAHPEIKPGPRHVLQRLTNNPYTRMTHSGWKARLDELINKK